MLVNAVEVSRLVKTRALAAASGVCNEWRAQAQSFPCTACSLEGAKGGGEGPSSLVLLFPHHCGPLPEDSSWNLLVGTAQCCSYHYPKIAFENCF